MQATGNIILSTASFEGDAAILIDGAPVPVRIRRSARARAYRLTLDSARGGLRLSLPARANLTKALAWAQDHEAWVRAQLAKQPRRASRGTVTDLLSFQHGHGRAAFGQLHGGGQPGYAAPNDNDFTFAFFHKPR